MASIARALISVSDKTGVVEMAKSLGGPRSGDTFYRRYGQGACERRVWRSRMLPPTPGRPKFSTGA